MLFALLAIPVIAIGAIRVLLTFQIAAGYVIEKQLRFLLLVPCGKEALLDLLLVITEPVKIFINITT